MIYKIIGILMLISWTMLLFFPTSILYPILGGCIGFASATLIVRNIK